MLFRSVHWVRFVFTPAQIAAFKDAATRAVLGIEHAQYGHLAVMGPDTRAELAKDFDAI